MHPRITRRRLDIYACIGLVFVALSYAFAFFDFSRFPSEDAAMLMRYSEHLAQGHGVVWNIGEQPVDGATDFLFMVVLALLHKIGLTVEHAVHGVCYLAHLATVILVYLGARRHFGAPLWAALLSAGLLAVGPGTLYTEAYFGTSFFAFFIGMTWFFALLTIETIGSRLMPPLFAVVALATGLVRPEGVFLSLFVLVAIVCRIGFRRSKTIILYFALVFASLGGGYLFWRLNYFGYALPNPFYAKGGGHIHLVTLFRSVENVLILSFPFSIVLFYGMFVSVASIIADADKSRRLLRAMGTASLLLFGAGLFRVSNATAHEWMLFGRYSPIYVKVLITLLLLGVVSLIVAPVLARSLRQLLLAVFNTFGISKGRISYLDGVARDTLLILIPVVGFTVSWVLIEDHMNYLMRFQYPILPVILMSWPAILWQRGAIELGRVQGYDSKEPVFDHVQRTTLVRRLATVAMAVFVATALAASLRQHARLAAAKHHRDGRYDVAIMLREYGTNRFTMATTEAGLLPLYSQWRAVDLLGLNDKWIAHRGEVTYEYLDQHDPVIIVIAPKEAISMVPAGPNEHVRAKMVRKAKRYADDRGFTLAAAFGDDASKLHYYYVKNDFPHAEEIIEKIRTMTYSWYRNGNVSTNYAGTEE